jgi:hypothetical protein
MVHGNGSGFLIQAPAMSLRRNMSLAEKARENYLVALDAFMRKQRLSVET